MRLTPLVFSIAILGMPGHLQAAKPHRKVVHQVSSAIHKVRRGETAAKIARMYSLSLDELSALNPKINLAKLSVGTTLRVKGKLPEAKVAKAAPVAAPTSVTAEAPAVPMAPIPTIPANGPAVLVHLERLIPATMNVLPPVSQRKSIHSQPPFTSEDLAPVLPANAGLEYESSLASELGFEPADPDHLDLLWPVGTRRISSAWGPRMRTRTVRVVKASKSRRVRVRYQGSHKGVDLPAPMGTDVYAAQDGRVVFAGRDGGYGNCVFIDHGNGVETRYAHHRLNFVQVGDVVHRGQKIAEVGTTGHSTGPHLHFELRLNGDSQNPLAVLNDVEEIPAEMEALNALITEPQN
jgi:murein DD-endopeptidase MepM/ murein hydrolase activator NlpD